MISCTHELVSSAFVARFFLSPSFVEDDPVEKTAAPEDQGKVRYKGS